MVYKPTSHDIAIVGFVWTIAILYWLFFIPFFIIGYIINLSIKLFWIFVDNK